MLDPYRIVMESGELEKATGYKINWRMFGGGGDVIRAMASGDVQIGEVGSSPHHRGGAARARTSSSSGSSTTSPTPRRSSRATARASTASADLKGKKVATPFVSTSHYQLMVGMKAGRRSEDVTVMNMRPPEIAAAWERGDIDAAFIWDPVLAKVKANGKVIATSGRSARRATRPSTASSVDRDWAAKHKRLHGRRSSRRWPRPMRNTAPTPPSGRPTRPR